ncbi:hypothetical protein F3K34_27170 [Streptomyces sp. LBUM 1486]|uniref:hypothetical protein n=1 Tax=Streptomyces scabiei TaxID=1930 RepID=UPI001B340547|nr:hypothetical protein [Streptomyces sp. LBUM 1486]MBP5915746.1 hypothetical protein [Streptomyces sp. LBUM 1486]
MNGDRAELIAAGHEALAQLQYAHEVAIETVINEVQQQTGERLLVRQPGVLDASYGDLARMAVQVEHYAEAWRLVREWLLPGDCRTLGSVLKVMPAPVAHGITGHLRAAGVLSDG